MSLCYQFLEKKKVNREIMLNFPEVIMSDTTFRKLSCFRGKKLNKNVVLSSECFGSSKANSSVLTNQQCLFILPKSFQLKYSQCAIITESLSAFSSDNSIIRAMKGSFLLMISFLILQCFSTSQNALLNYSAEINCMPLLFIEKRIIKYSKPCHGLPTILDQISSNKNINPCKMPI